MKISNYEKHEHEYKRKVYEYDVYDFHCIHCGRFAEPEEIEMALNKYVQLESRIKELEEKQNTLRLFAHAELQTLGDGRDYSLAAYTLRDLPITEKAGLLDLAWALSRDGSTSRGDWEGFKTSWLEYLLDVQKGVKKGGE